MNFISNIELSRAFQSVFFSACCQLIIETIGKVYPEGFHWTFEKKVKSTCVNDNGDFSHFLNLAFLSQIHRNFGSNYGTLFEKIQHCIKKKISLCILVSTC